MALACSPTWCVIARHSRRQDDWEMSKREKETTVDEQHMRGIWNSKETSWRQMFAMCRSDGSQWPAKQQNASSSKGGNVTCAGWQVTLCDSIWHMSSRSGEALANCYTWLLYFTLLLREVDLTRQLACQHQPQLAVLEFHEEQTCLKAL